MDNVNDNIVNDSINEMNGPDRLSHRESLAEAMLFAAGSPVTTEDIAIQLKVRYAEAEKAVEGLKKFYEEHNSGLTVKKIGNSFQLASRPDLHSELKSYFEQVTSAPLSRASLEALTIIAFNQPITRGGVEIVRGVNSDSVVSTLIERGLIREVGKSESPGRPVLYGTTDLFLKSAGVSDIDELRQLIGVPEAGAATEEAGEDIDAAIAEETIDGGDVDNDNVFDDGRDDCKSQ